MLPGKVFRPEDVLRILRKRAWLILVPWAMIAAGTAWSRASCRTRTVRLR
jgi:hypothetical protein